MFELHSALAADSVPVVDLPLCRVLLMNDANYPWLILVPRRADLVEVFDLPETERARMWREVDAVGQALARQTGAHKMNIATLGNQVPQLHVHCIARFRDDPAWPRPVWGVHPAHAYAQDQLRERVDTLRELLEDAT